MSRPTIFVFFVAKPNRQNFLSSFLFSSSLYFVSLVYFVVNSQPRTPFQTNTSPLKKTTGARTGEPGQGQSFFRLLALLGWKRLRHVDDRMAVASDSF